MSSRVSRIGVRDGYDRWAASYDQTKNPLVYLDRQNALRHLGPRPSERILDAGCGTGANLRTIRRTGACPVGVDFSLGMLRVARQSLPDASLVQADLNREIPLRHESFDGLLCSLVSEHLTQLRTFFSEAFSVLCGGGRMVFSAFHPEIAASGVEANFELGGTEYRLGAERHSVDDYLGHIHEAGFRSVRRREYSLTSEFVEKLPSASKYSGQPLLLVVDASRPRASAVRQVAAAGR